jgi:hypothetical protein
MYIDLVRTVWLVPAACRSNRMNNLGFLEILTVILSRYFSTWYLCFRKMHRILVREPEGKRQVGRPRHRWENNIKI